MRCRVGVAASDFDSLLFRCADRAACRCSKCLGSGLSVGRNEERGAITSSPSGGRVLDVHSPKAKRLSCIVYRGNGSCVLSSDKRYTMTDKRQMKNDLSSRTSRLQSRNFHNLSSLKKKMSMMTMIMVIKTEHPSGGL